MLAWSMLPHLARPAAGRIKASLGATNVSTPKFPRVGEAEGPQPILSVSEFRKTQREAPRRWSLFCGTKRPADLPSTNRIKNLKHAGARREKTMGQRGTKTSAHRAASFLSMRFKLLLFMCVPAVMVIQTTHTSARRQEPRREMMTGLHAPHHSVSAGPCDD